MNRTSVARGVAVGLFCGVMIPVAQIVPATVMSIVARANILVAAVSTLVANPLTLPFVYYYAYRIGSRLAPREADMAEDAAASEEAAARALEVTTWLDTLLTWVASVAMPFLTGLTALAIAAALLGYVCAHATWGLREAVRNRRAATRRD